MEPASSNLFDLVIDQPVNAYLTQTVKWGKFLSIVGIVFCGIFILIGLFFGTFMSSFMFQSFNSFDGVSASPGVGILFTIIYLVIGILALMPNIYLYRYSAKMKTALAASDQLMLTDSFKNLKSMFKFYGICMIIVLSFYALALVIGVLSRLFIH